MPYLNLGTFLTFPQNPTQPIIMQISATHKEALRVQRRQTPVIKCIENQLTNAFEDKYLEEINNTYAGYNSLSIQEILAYLYDRFGKGSTLELEEAEKIFSEPFNAAAPFGSFMNKIKETVNIAEAASCSCTPEQIMAKVFNCILKVQVLLDIAIRDQK